MSSPLFCCPLVFDALFTFAFEFTFMPPLFIAFPPRCAIMPPIVRLLAMAFPLPVLAHVEDVVDCAGGGAMPNDDPDPCPGGGGIENDEPRDGCAPSDGR